MSWPVPGTMMIEPTESESFSELNRFCDTLIKIKKEIDKIKSGDFDKLDNPIKNAPHTDLELASDEWNHKYSREEAAYPAKFLKINKFLSPYTLSTLATGGQYLNVFKNSDGYAASSLSYL